MNDRVEKEISDKLNVLIALTLKQVLGERGFESKRRKGVGEIARFMSDLGLDAKDIASILGSPVTSIRTLLTPTRRK